MSLHANITKTADGWVVRVGRWLIATKPTEAAAVELQQYLARPEVYLDTTAGRRDFDLTEPDGSPANPYPVERIKPPGHV